MGHRATRLVLGIIATTIVCSGCVSFSGPNDVRRAIAKQEHVELEQQVGITIGPVGVFLASAIAGEHLPVDINGIDWVSYGEYVATPHSAEPLSLRDLDLPGWERVVRICEASEDVLVMVPNSDAKLTKMLVVMREDEEVRIVRAEGDLEAIIDQLFESDMVDTDILAVLDGAREDVRIARDVTVSGDIGTEALALAVAREG